MWEPNLRNGILPEQEVAADEEAESRWTYESEPVSGQFIVRFRDYKMASDHKQALQDHLEKHQHWKFIDRNNPAAKFPTDFALVEIDLDEAESIKVRTCWTLSASLSRVQPTVMLQMHPCFANGTKHPSHG